jgi:hypothetical protein
MPDDDEASAAPVASESAPRVLPRGIAHFSASAQHIEMVWSPLGAEATNAKDCRGLADGSAFVYQMDGQLFLVTARHNLTGKHWQTNEYIGSRPVSPTHL